MHHLLEQISVRACLPVGLSVNWYIFIVKNSHWFSIKLDTEYLDQYLAIQFYFGPHRSTVIRTPHEVQIGDYKRFLKLLFVKVKR
jgi:hypothetical protein